MLGQGEMPQPTINPHKAMPLSLVEACTGNDTDKLFAAEFEADNSLYDRLFWTNVDATQYNYSQTVSIGTGGMRGLNETVTGTTSQEMPFTENRRFFSDFSAVDRQIVAGDPAIRTKAEFRKLQAMKEKWTRLFIKGSSAENPREFDGLQARASAPGPTGQPSRRTIANSATGDVLSKMKLRQAIRNTKGNAILMSEELLDWFSESMEGKNNVIYRMDEFGKTLAFYGSLPIIPIGKDSNELSFLPNTEISPDGLTSNECTSIYVVGFGEGRLQGLNFRGVGGKYGFDIKDQGEVGTELRTLIEWPCSIVVEDPKCLTRLSGIKLGPITN